MMEWLNTNAGAVQGISTVALVLITVDTVDVLSKEVMGESRRLHMDLPTSQGSK